MPTYRVREGKTHGASRQYKAGDLVVMTKQEAEPFMDKLELVSESDDPEVAKAQAAAAEDSGDEGDLTRRHFEAQREEPTDVKNPQNQGPVGDTPKDQPATTPRGDTQAKSKK